MDLCGFRASLVYIEFQNSQGYIMSPCFNNNKKKEKKEEEEKEEVKINSTGLLFLFFLFFFSNSVKKLGYENSHVFRRD